MNLFNLFLFYFQITYTYPILPLKGQNIEDFVPVGYHIITQTKGNLNKDTITDLAAIIEADDNVMSLKEIDHDQKPRILFVLFGLPKSGFSLSIQSNTSVLLSDDGGVFGDPLQELFIERNTLCVEYYGGSSDKWAYTYKWRWQNKDWYLIGATYTTMSPYENLFEKYDFNLNTGIAEHTVMPYLETDDIKQKVSPKTKRFKPGKKPFYRLENFHFGKNLLYKDIFL